MTNFPFKREASPIGDSAGNAPAPLVSMAKIWYN